MLVSLFSLDSRYCGGGTSRETQENRRIRHDTEGCTREENKKCLLCITVRLFDIWPRSVFTFANRSLIIYLIQKYTLLKPNTSANCPSVGVAINNYIN